MVHVVQSGREVGRDKRGQREKVPHWTLELAVIFVPSKREGAP